VPRQLYMVLSPRSLSYAHTALESLFRNAAEPIHLNLITDSAADAQALRDVLATLSPAAEHTSHVASEADLDDAEATLFAGRPNLRAFRHGHPCWRKVTDPLLLSAPGEEMILLDPDLYFPNPFRFETTPATGLALMYQQPNCLLPPEVVRRAIAAGIQLAHHVDIGVSHWRSNADLEWLDWLLGKLGAPDLPRRMHVEAIVWAAIAMREGGGYLDPTRWVCWHRTQTKRIRRKLGASGDAILASEPWSRMKCFHAGGEAKWWVPAYVAQHASTQPRPVIEPSTLTPFIELTPAHYEREQSAKQILHNLGYYRLFGTKST
jgi:hypothetical protein